ncbi:MAG: class I SAM-dependent methyltransferase [Gammaproteobacteria bacterium]|nr:class I SAM-dependent methyltransferase [Gammaproteobacteria bacterium]NND36764.1 class I SAM-dependent methyltransferase [Gammaproteobacteria bacterium]
MGSGDKENLLPDSPVEGLVPTMNNTGWMTVTLDDVSTEFTRYAGSIDEEALDIGCAYGIATLAALECGARVCACDMDAGHLDIVERRVDSGMKDRLRCVQGAMPDIDFDPGSFGAVLASRVLHFLNGEQVEQTLAKMHDWLIPGGRVFLVADSPYTGPWRTLSDDYERRKAAGEPWPGFVADYAQFLPAGQDPSKHPSFINPMDPDTLAQACTGAGFDVLEARWLASGTKHATGRDHAGVAAVRN